MIYFLTVNYYSTNLVSKLIKSLNIRESTCYKMVIVNNSPEDNSIHELKTKSTVILDAETNLGFGGGCNLGIRWIYGQDRQAIVWIINPDAYLIEDCLNQVNTFFQFHPEVSILGTAVYTPDGKLWFGGGKFYPDTGGVMVEDLLNLATAAKEEEEKYQLEKYQPEKYQPEKYQLEKYQLEKYQLEKPDYISCDWVSGCSLIINLDNFQDCPLFDTAYFLYYEDFDFCQRYRREGHLVAITNKFHVFHQPSSITQRNIVWKIQHSTYSYLLTLERYTNKFVQLIRLSKLLFNGFLLLFFQPEASWGKFYGFWLYVKR